MGRDTLTVIRNIPRTLPDFRPLIKAELARRNWTPKDLVESLRGKATDMKSGKPKDVPQATVYDFLRGTSTVNSDYLGLMLDVLGILVGDQPAPPPAKPARKKGRK